MSTPRLPRSKPADPVQRADLALSRPLVTHAERKPVRLVGAIADLSDQEPLYAATATLAAAGLLLRDERLARSGLEMLAAHLLATALRGMVKASVDRTRPMAAARRGRYELGEGERFESDFNSFPSGHTAGAAAAGLTLARHYPATRTTVVTVVGAVAGAQVLRSKHWLTDVVAGAAIGWAAAALIGGLIRRAEDL